MTHTALVCTVFVCVCVCKIGVILIRHTHSQLEGQQLISISDTCKDLFCLYSVNILTVSDNIRTVGNIKIKCEFNLDQ